MSESSPPTPSRYESVIDKQIRAARDRGELDTRIVAWIRNPTPPPVRVGRVDTEAVLERWRENRAATGPARPAEPAQAPPARRRWWHKR